MEGDHGLDLDSITPTAPLVHDDAPRPAYVDASQCPVVLNPYGWGTGSPPIISYGGWRKGRWQPQGTQIPRACCEVAMTGQADRRGLQQGQ